MKAMIFAAGLGTRLQPLTEHIPKALVQVGGMTLLERVILKLKQASADDIIINVHHHYEQIIDFVDKHDFGVKISFSIEKDGLLDTGGGLKKASPFFDDNQDFIIHNVDVISDIDLREMLYFHRSQRAIATLAVRNRISQRYFLFDETNHLCGRENHKTGTSVFRSDFVPQTPLHRFAFSGIQIVSPEIFQFMSDEPCFPITDIYLKTADKAIAYPHNYGNWMDMGQIENIVAFEQSNKQ
jgi:NDP-sugar pyrophosphorylase family protein